MNEGELVKNGFGFSIGVIIMFLAAEVYHWSRYLKANPAVGEISATPWTTPFYIIVIIIGVFIAYTFFMRGLASILAATTDE